jgi:hypothetical protein
VYGQWTTKVPPLAANTNEGTTKYPYLYSCIQTRTSSTATPTCTDVLLDENTTVIDGGQIITNSVTANEIASHTITSNEMATNSITIGNMDSSTVSQVSNANIDVGGRNLLKNTHTLDKWAHSSGITITKDTSEDIYVCNFPEVTSISWRVIQNCPQEVILPYSLVRDKTVTLSYWFKMDAIPSSDIIGTNFVNFALNNAGVYTSQRKLWSGNVVYGKTESVTTWQKIERTIEVTDSVFTQGTGTITDTDLFYIQFYNHNTVATHLKGFKLEIGNKATDWSPAPEDTDVAIATAVDGINIGGVNFYGYGSDMQTSLSGLNNYGSGFSIVTEDGIKCAHTTGALNTTRYLQSKLTFTPKPMETWTFSGDVKIKNIVRGTTNPMCEFYFGGATIDGTWRGWSITSWKLDGVETNLKTMGFDWHITDTKWHHVAVTAYFNYNGTSTIPAMLSNIYLRDATGDLYIHHVKLERGNKATDWNTTETEYITRIDNGGIKVHDAGDTSNYSKIDSTGMGVYQGGTETSKFGASKIELAKNNAEAEINFCNSSGYISTINSDLSIGAKKSLNLRCYDYDWYTPSQYGTSGTLDLDVTDNGSVFWRTYAERDWGVSSEWGDYPDHFMYPKIGAYGTWYDNLNYADILCPKVWIGTGSSALWHGLYSEPQYDGDSTNALQGWVICVDANKNIRIPKAYTDTTSSSANLNIASGGVLARSTSSSKRYKKDIKDIEDKDLDPNHLYDARVVQFKYRDDYLAETDQRFNKDVVGFIVEELENVYPIAIDYVDEQPEDWSARYLIPPMLKLIQDQHKEIEELKARIESLEKEK